MTIRASGIRTPTTTKIKRKRRKPGISKVPSHSEDDWVGTHCMSTEAVFFCFVLFCIVIAAGSSFRDLFDFDFDSDFEHLHSPFFYMHL